jgi:hypothetical protein
VALSGTRGVARDAGMGAADGGAADSDESPADGLGARGAIGAGFVTGCAPRGACAAEDPPGCAFTDPSRNSSDSFGISFAPMPRRSRQFRLSGPEPLVEF